MYPIDEWATSASAALATGPVTLVVDEADTIVHCGGSVEEIFGCAAASVVGTRASQYFTDLAQPEASVVALVSLRRGDGASLPVRVRVDRWQAESSRYFIVTIDPDTSHGSAAYHQLYSEAAASVARATSLIDAAAVMIPVLASAVGWDAATVWTPGESDHLSCRLFWSAEDRPELRDLTLRAEISGGHDLAGQVRATATVQSTDELGDQSERAAVARRSGLRSAVAFPILIGQEVAGVVELFSSAPITPDAGLLRLLHHIGVELGFLIQREENFRALQRSEARYRQLAMTHEDAQHFAHVGSFFVDCMTESVQWSDEMYRLFGLAPGSRPIDREYARSRIVEKERLAVRTAVDASLHGGAPLNLKFTIAPEDGGERVLRVRGKLIDLDDGHRKLVGSALDVTADENAAHERLELQRELDDAKRITSLGRLAATMAHEFNNILAGIGSFAEFLARRATNDETRNATSQIRAAIKRGKGVTGEILRYARASKPAFSTIEVRSWLEAFLPEANALTEGRVALEAGEEIYVRADVGQLNQALANLVINARDASPAGEQIVIRIAKSERDGRPVLDLAVIDRGTGVPAEIRDRIFEPLFTTKRTGTGLGLPLVDQIVRAHGGAVRLHSESGVGSEFHILLPAANEPPERTAEGGAMNVLLADDNETFAGVIAQVLAMQGVHVRVVYQASDVIPALAQEMADVLILDIGLPDMTGSDAYAAIIDRWPGLPVVFVSGRHSAPIEHLVRERHVAFLQKPFEIDDLLAALKRVVAAGVCALGLLAPCA